MQRLSTTPVDSKSPFISALAMSISIGLAPQFSSAREVLTSGPESFDATASPTTAPHLGGQTRMVKNCHDAGADSLREIVQNVAQPGDTVDLSLLSDPMYCSTPSVITLSSGEIAVAQDDLAILGPSGTPVTVSAARMSRVFRHTGAGTLTLGNLMVLDGYYHATATAAYGGCVSTEGSLFLSHVTVSDCSVASDMRNSGGGGIGAPFGNIVLVASRIDGNHAIGSYDNFGGGVSSGGSTTAKYSSISANTTDDGLYFSSGGGISAADAVIVASTIDNNTASFGGGISTLGTTSIVDSTISTNTARRSGGGLSAFNADSATIANSTVAENVAADLSGGIYFRGSSNSTLTLQSSIIAKNVSIPSDMPADVYIEPFSGVLAGADNLVVTSNVLDPVVITLAQGPKLGPLQFNGGPTRSHMLLAGSPALGKGNANALPPSFNTTDQRGKGYARATGTNASVDLGAVQFDSIFADSFNSDLF